MSVFRYKVTGLGRAANCAAWSLAALDRPHDGQFTTARYSSPPIFKAKRNGHLNMDMGIYYYTTYDEPEIKAINMNDVELDRSCLYAYGVKGS